MRQRLGLHSVSLLWRLVLIAAVAIIPLAIVGLDLAHTVGRQAMLRAKNDNTATVRLLEANIDDLLRGIISLLQSLAQLPAVGSMRAEAISDVLVPILPNQPSLLNLFVSDPTGRLRSSVIWRQEDAGRAKPATQVASTVALHSPTVSGRVMSRVTNAPAVDIMVPIFRGSHVVGVIGAELSVEQIQSRLLQVAGGAHTAFIVTDEFGATIAHTEYYRYIYSVQNMIELPPIRDALGGQPGAVSYQDPSTHEKWFAVSSLTNAGPWAVAVTVPLQEIDAAEWSVFVRGIVALVVAASLALGLAIYLSLRITAPVRTLTRAAHRVAAGDFQQQVPESGAAELRLLSRTFNGMAQELDSMTADLIAARHALGIRARWLSDLYHGSLRLQEAQRRRLALDIHDELAQLVIGALMEVRAASRASGYHPSLKRAAGLLVEVSDKLRDLIFDLRPPILDDAGLEPAIRQLLSNFNAHSGVATSIEVVGMPRRLNERVETELFRIVQESLNNVWKHAAAQQVRCTLVFDGTRVVVSIFDDGRGYDPAKQDPLEHTYRVGQASMRERAREIDARLTISSSPGQGCRVICSLPLRWDD